VQPLGNRCKKSAGYPKKKKCRYPQGQQHVLKAHQFHKLPQGGRDVGWHPDISVFVFDSVVLVWLRLTFFMVRVLGLSQK
jgi:hypothetical protein